MLHDEKATIDRVKAFMKAYVPKGCTVVNHLELKGEYPHATGARNAAEVEAGLSKEQRK